MKKKTRFHRKLSANLVDEQCGDDLNAKIKSPFMQEDQETYT